MKRTIPLLLVLAAGPVAAQETRGADAHEHGVGALNMAIEDGAILMEFHAPGADIVGFEYAAKTDEDRARVEDAVAMLGDPLDLFAFPQAAGCSVEAASAALEIEGEDAHHEEEDHDHAHDHEEEEHADDHGDDHGDDHAEEHADHAEEHSDEHADDHGEEHAEEASHSEFHAEYQLTCTDPTALTSMTFAYFDTFENAREVEVQIVTRAGAQAFEVTRDDPTLDLSGLF